MRPYVKHSLTNPQNIRIAAIASLAINIGWLHLLSNWWLGLSGSTGNTANKAITLTLQPATISTAVVTSLQESSLRSDEAPEPAVESSSAFAEQQAVDPPSERPNDSPSGDLDAQIAQPKTALNVLPEITPELIRESMKGLQWDENGTEDRSIGEEAAIFDSRLIERLNTARNRPGKATPMNSPVGELQLTGSGWQQRFEVDGRCFEVQLADPLVSFSQDRWYRVACND